MAHFLVIGSTSLDTLHVNGKKIPSAGGAGMYTAVAAHRSGVDISMVGPRPEPIPDLLKPVAERLQIWHGESTNPADLPHFEITHQEDKAIYLECSFGIEHDLTPDILPEDLSDFDGVHVTPMGDAQRQLDFIEACIIRGAKYISAGTFIDFIETVPDIVKTSMSKIDVIFMNEKEAISLFGSLENAKTLPGKLLYVTLGKKGAMVVQGDFATKLQTQSVQSVDATGAGDTFCGATVANLLKGVHPIMAARLGMALAAEMVQSPGPKALLKSAPAPGIHLDERVLVNDSMVEKISEFIKNYPEVLPFDFTGEEFPPVGQPAALDYFFISVLQQFSFWETSQGKYSKPMIASLDGVMRKGAFYLFKAYMRPFQDDPAFYTPERQAKVTRGEMLELFRADDGSDPMPALDLHVEMANSYGRDMLALGYTTRDLLEKVQQSEKPLQALMVTLDHIAGFKEDSLRKKSGLLALVLNQRPERFLEFGEGEDVAPVVDYHAMRFCLRTGLVDVVDEALKEKLVSRALLTPTEEWAVRNCVYRAEENLVRVSGKSLGAVDWFIFNARKRCPEMSEPLCSECPLDAVCAHRKELFQAVMRTTFY
ncbi:MAG: carbohydrate kinase family protein [Anaerolineaceae bacterium]|nr:carbohydrate kinase family protein [Anaerolineaceae bacterium]